MNQRSTIPITQLINAVGAPYQNQHNRQVQEPNEDFKLCRQYTAFYFGIWRSYVPPCKLERQGDEDAEGEDLPGETGDGDIDGGFVAAGGLGG